jgi:predicted Holliday junction resolvase-like endonuclease
LRAFAQSAAECFDFPTQPYRVARPAPPEFDKIDRQQRLLQAAIDKLELIEDRLREAARKAGLRQAQKQLRKVGKLFSASKLDPHDAKVICDPVQYVVFDGMTKGRLRRVLLCASEPTSKGQELTSIYAALAAGNVECGIVRISADGTCSSS